MASHSRESVGVMAWGSLDRFGLLCRRMKGLGDAVAPACVLVPSIFGGMAGKGRPDGD